MRKAIGILAIIVGIGIAAYAQGSVSVGVEESFASEWEQFAADLEEQSGIALEIQPYSNTYLQLWLRFSRFQLSMIQEGWVSVYSRYWEDLSEIETQLSASGIDLVYHGNKPVAVPISFAPGWLLAVLSWPSGGEQEVASILAAAAAGTAAPDHVVSTGLGQTYGASKMARAEHNPHVDGALTALVQAVESTVGAMSAVNFSDLPNAVRSTVSAVANAFGVPLSSEESAVTVVMEASFGGAVNASIAALSALGIGNVDVAATSNLIRVSVPLSLLETVLGQLSSTVYIRPPYVPHALAIRGEGVAAIGATAFHAQGINGSGSKVAIIDLGFSGLSQSQASGDIPYGVSTYDASGTGIASGVSHGTAVAEIVHEIAPGAQLYLIKIADEVDLDQAVTYCINNGIDIINHSLGWYNTNFYDGTGPIAAIAQRAIDAGILWVNSAGNEAERHWEGTYSDGNADGKLDSSITLQARAGERVVLYLTWNEWPASSTDYDLYVYDPLNNVVAASTKYQTGTEEPTESVQFQANMNGTYRIEIAGSGSERIELFSLFQGLTPVVTSSSIIAPANVRDVLTVGAVSVTPYSGTLQIEPYSSRGPTNDGRTKPDLVAPDAVSTSVSGYAPFLGTSCAAPHVTGAAALLLSAQPTSDWAALRAHILSQVVPAGAANTFGAGRLLLSLAPANQPPTASFTFSPTSPAPGEVASFNGLGSSDSDGSITQYTWSFGDGATASGSTTSHAYTAAGTYTAQLTVTDNDGATDSTTRSITIQALPNQSPTASFSFSPSAPIPGQQVAFNGSLSSDSDGTIIQYAWSFGDGYTASGVTASHAYAGAGTFAAQLTVTDDDGASNSATRFVTVQPSPNQPPTASFTMSPSSPVTGSAVQFNASASTDVDGTIVSYAWTFGDGATASGSTATHTYTSSGNFTATLVVTDDDGGTDAESRTISVSTPQLADLVVTNITHSPASPQLGASVGFEITIRNQGAIGAGLFRIRLSGASSAASTYVWQLSAGNSTTVSLSRTLTQASETFTVELDDLQQIEESNEANNITTHIVTAGVPAPVADAGGPYSGTVGQ
ncbi:PKD domain-containing protein, partial [Candidatus Bipolaricaulota bacterium]|nr:PKD domain-containing protein [Candidatus Bipolaricaulota bacterium]